MQGEIFYREDGNLFYWEPYIRNTNALYPLFKQVGCMPQFFRSYANTGMRIGMLGVFAGPVVLGFALMGFNRSPYITQVGLPKGQPVQFSHEHHAGALGIDCRFCHTSVETSSYANIPPMKTCMTCHSQIWVNSVMLAPVRESYASRVPLQWNRVHDLPDFAYFNHSIHVNKGFGCSTCHGRVDKMPLVYREQPLFMSWCLNCHRNPEKYVRPESQIFTMGWRPPANQATLGPQLVKQNQIRKLDDCYVCHR